jgi:hypothetical protein
MGFKVLTEFTSSEGQVDLCLELAGNVYLILESKYCPDETKQTKAERNLVLAKAEKELLPKPIYNKTIDQVTENKLIFLEYDKVISMGQKDHLTGEELNKYLAEAAYKNLTEIKIVNALAEAVEK